MSFTKGHPEGVKYEVYNAQHGYCCVEGCTNFIEEFHHPLHNTKSNRERFPLLINSPINCRGTCRNHHINYSKYPELNITDDIAEVYEKWLNELNVK